MYNLLPVNIHEDNRRKLIEYVIDFPIRTCKAIVVKEDNILGNHWHQLKEEIFYLLQGSGSVTIGEETHELKENDIVHAPKGVKHTFHLKAGSILLEAGTEPFDKNDDYKT